MTNREIHLGALSFATSRPLPCKSSAIGVWKGAGITTTQTDFEFRADATFRALTVLEASRSLVMAIRPRKLAIGGHLSIGVPQESYRTHVTQPMTCVTLYLEPSLLEATLDVLYTPAMAAENVSQVREGHVIPTLLRALLKDVEAGTPAGPTLGESIISAIVQLLHPAEIGKAEIRDRRSARLSARGIEAVKEAIHARMAEPIHLVELAQTTGLGVRQFSRCFRGSFGTSPHQYIIKTRVERAKELILASHESLDEIAWTVGFADRNHMATAFRKIMRVAPSHFRHTRLNGIR